MAALNKFECFVEDLAEGVHNLAGDTLKIALCNDTVTPNASTHDELADFSSSEIAYTNVVTSPVNRILTVSSSSQSSGVYRLIISDMTVTATGGAIPTFRYIIIYNDTASNDELIGWYDYGANLDLSIGETLTLDFDGTNGILSLT